MSEELFTELDVEPQRQRVAHGVRIALLAAMALLALAALADLFGQQAEQSSAGGRVARLTVSAPQVVRGGLLTQVRMRIHALRTIQQPQLVLDRGWFEGMQVNGIEPQPSQESGFGRKVILAYDRLDAGKTLTVWLALQVDPTVPGKRTANIRLQDGTTSLASVARSLTVLP